MSSNNLDSPLISDLIHNWVSAQIKEKQFSVIQLAGDASARRYYRVIKDEKTWVLMHWEPFISADYPFLSVQKHFETCGVHVPEIVAVGADQGLLLLDDLGDLTLERKFWEQSSPEASFHFYQKTLDELIKIHDKATHSETKSTASVTKFDTAKFLWEMNYAKEHLLQGLLKIKMNDSTAKELENVFTDFCTKLDREPKVICHRDFHSRNVMIRRDKVYIIDFQDARLGPVQYDLVSLFKDSYVDITDDYSKVLMNYYMDNSTEKKKSTYSAEHFQKTYELQSLQRCFKACGSFASFMNMRQDRRYLKYLIPTLKRVMKSLLHFPEYTLLQSLLIDSGALEKNYETMT
jgi:aminoglycoside/choline kinase family phosphotransferase